MKPTRIFLFLILGIFIFVIFFLVRKTYSGNISNQIITMNNNETETIREVKIAEDASLDFDSTKIKNDLQNKNNNEKLFNDFINHFPKAIFPLVFDKSFFKNQTLNSDSTLKINNKFSVFLPEVNLASNKNQMEIKYKYVGNVFENEKITAVIYTRTISYNEMEKLNGQVNTYTSLAIYDKKGKSIAEQNIAYSSNYEDYLSGTFNQDLNFKTQRFVFVRAKDVEKSGYENNPIKYEKPVEEILYSLSQTGEIKVLKPGFTIENVASK